MVKNSAGLFTLFVELNDKREVFMIRKLKNTLRQTKMLHISNYLTYCQFKIIWDIRFKLMLASFFCEIVDVILLVELDTELLASVNTC